MKKKLTIFLVSIFAFPTFASADIWAEREALGNIGDELAALEALVMTAKSQSNSADRMTFNYGVLLADLKKIRGGISHHLTVPMEPVVPSSINALSTGYTEYK